MKKKVFKHPDVYNPGDILITEQEILARFDELAQEIHNHYPKTTNLLVVGLLTSAAWITTDMYARLHKYGFMNSELAFMKVSSYQTSGKATNVPEISFTLANDPKGRDILIIDDIADTGKTLSVVTKHLYQQRANSVSTLVLLDKPSRREVVFAPTFIGFTIPNIWVQGRGMDSDEIGRGEANIIKGPFKYPE